MKMRYLWFPFNKATYLPTQSRKWPAWTSREPSTYWLNSASIQIDQYSIQETVAFQKIRYYE